MEQEQEKEWLTPPEAAAYLGIPEHRLGRLRRLGRIKGIEGGGDHTRYSMYHISWLQNVDTSDKRRGKKKGKPPVPLTKDYSSYLLAEAV